jgi:hypothetical protein
MGDNSASVNRAAGSRRQARSRPGAVTHPPQPPAKPAPPVKPVPEPTRSSYQGIVKRDKPAPIAPEVRERGHRSLPGADHSQITGMLQRAEQGRFQTVPQLRIVSKAVESLGEKYPDLANRARATRAAVVEVLRVIAFNKQGRSRTDAESALAKASRALRDAM